MCMSCGATEGAKETPVPLRTVACDACWDDAVHFPGRESEQIDVELTLEQLRPGPVTDPRDGGGTTSHDCGAACSWHRAECGRWLLLEPGGYPTDKIPPASDGGSSATARL
jgi:hypothetical protein